MSRAIPEQSPMFIHFAHAGAAMEYRANVGGWIFIPNNSAGATWFDPWFTASRVMTHYAARGSGRLV